LQLVSLASISERKTPQSNTEERLVDDYTPALGGLAPAVDIALLEFGGTAAD
jgi:hypothetical protein